MSIHTPHTPKRRTTNTTRAEAMAGDMADRYAHELPEALREMTGRKPTKAQVKAACLGYFMGAGMMAEAMLDIRDLKRIIRN